MLKASADGSIVITLARLTLTKLQAHSIRSRLNSVHYSWGESARYISATKPPKAKTLRQESVFLLLHAAYTVVVTHLNNTTNKRKQGYPEVITCLPEADIQFEGVKAWILQANTRQLVFFEFEADAKVPEHSHGYPQWGMVIDGKMELTINDKPRICEKGDEYVIPTGAKHRARFLSRTRVMDLFSEKNRYKPKTIKQAKAQEA